MITQEQLTVLGCVLGCDVSSYQRNIDWAWMKANNFQFAYVKITEGDKSFEGNHYDIISRCLEIQKQGIKLGYYHFCDMSASREIDWIKDHMALLTAADLPLMLDIETNIKNFSKDYIQHYLGNLINSLADLESEVILYSGTAFINENIDISLKDQAWWIACYNPKLILPTGWTQDDWKIWQYAIDKPNNVQIDMDVMKTDFFNKY